MKRIVFIVNILNMLVVVCEVLIYIGIIIVEYFRDMGYLVVFMVDLISCWVEVFCEMLGCLEEMLGDEGYLVYLVSRIVEFYERVGFVECLGNGEEGVLIVIGVVFSLGGDILELVF